MKSAYIVRMNIPGIETFAGDKILKIFYTREEADSFVFQCQDEIQDLYKDREYSDIHYRGFQIETQVPYTWVAGPFEIGSEVDE